MLQDYLEAVSLHKSMYFYLFYRARLKKKDVKIDSDGDLYKIIALAALEEETH